MILKTLPFILALAIAPATFAGAPRCSRVFLQTPISPELTAAQAQMKSILEKLDDENLTDHQKKKLVLQARRAGAKILDLLKVKYTVDENDHGALRITQSNASLFNKIALALGERNRQGLLKGSGLRLKFDPEELVKLNAGALFEEETFALLLSFEEVQGLGLSDYGVHELRHAAVTMAALQGLEHQFYGSLKNKETSPAFHETYQHEFALDELSGYIVQIRAELAELSRLQKTSPGSAEFKDKLSGATSIAQSGLQLTQAALQAATKILSEKTSPHLIVVNSTEELTKDPTHSRKIYKAKFSFEDFEMEIYSPYPLNDPWGRLLEVQKAAAEVDADFKLILESLSRNDAVAARNSTNAMRRFAGFKLPKPVSEGEKPTKDPGSFFK